MTQITLDDTLDSRREVWRLLHRMRPDKRLAYLERCCAAVRGGLGYGLRPLPVMYAMALEAMRCDRADDRLTNAIYADLIQLAGNRGLDLLAVALDLERVAKGQLADLRSAALRRP